MVTRAAGCLLSAEEDFEVNGKINSLGKKAQFPHPGKKNLCLEHLQHQAPMTSLNKYFPSAYALFGLNVFYILTVV